MKAQTGKLIMITLACPGGGGGGGGRGSLLIGGLIKIKASKVQIRILLHMP